MLTITERNARQQGVGAPLQRRLATLDTWLVEQIGFREDSVTLPATRRRYAIRIPTDDAREYLFARAKADPSEVLPHWANVWASGMALADVVLARRDELADRNILELGSGLGVTATAALEAGARLHAMDYSPLALAFCRYNALYNTGRAPNTLCVNWAAPDRQIMARAESLGAFNVILAADVLYESRDIDPLLRTIDRLLAPGGELWLAEPCRMTAQRFLSTVALAGWQGESVQTSGPWHDGLTHPVNIHYLRRPSSIDALQSTLGGWRV
jgi:predicted nicotinamide N-methyase